jgi:hypothetical protein
MEILRVEIQEILKILGMMVEITSKIGIQLIRRRNFLVVLSVMNVGVLDTSGQIVEI